MPEVREDGSTAVPGLYVVGDLAGVPLLKFSSHTGAQAVRSIVSDPHFDSRNSRDGSPLDLVIVGAGVSGMAAALEAKRHGLRFELLEASEPFWTIQNFPKGKPIYTYPTEMTPDSPLQFPGRADVKEALLDDMHAQVDRAGIEATRARVERVTRKDGALEVAAADGSSLRAHRVIVAIGRSGNFRRLGVSGEGLDKVYNRLHDPQEFVGQNVLVVGGGDSALEAAIAVAAAGGHVTLSYRKAEFSRPKPDNVDRIAALAAGEEGGGSLRLVMSSQVREIQETEVVLEGRDGKPESLANDAVIAMIGREPPLDFFRRSGIGIRGEWTAKRVTSFALVLLAAIFVYHWKTDAGIPVKHWFQEAGWFPFNIPVPSNPASLPGTVGISIGQPGFHYSLAYCLCVLGFGWARVRRRRTPYVRLQTITLALIQCVPLFLLPYVLLPWAGHNGWFSEGAALKPAADALFPVSEWSQHGREYWRSLGLILAWPLFLWNVFTSQPMWAWLGISLVQTFALIPLVIWRWGKGAYCGWICSCGALAETMGDAHRQKMPHGPVYNRLNLVGQAILVVTAALLVLRVIGWILPHDHWVNTVYMGAFLGRDVNWGSLVFPLSFLNYAWGVDLLLAGIIGVGSYWHFSGRVWCRFGCPLAALMHIYASFSQFRILSDKKKCISCNVCTSVCHQGIDVMNFANKGQPMADPQCVRCSACVQSCPTGVLAFGRVSRGSGEVLATDGLPASPVQVSESGTA